MPASTRVKLVFQARGCRGGGRHDGGRQIERHQHARSASKGSGSAAQVSRLAP